MTTNRLSPELEALAALAEFYAREGFDFGMPASPEEYVLIYDAVNAVDDRLET